MKPGRSVNDAVIDVLNRSGGVVSAYLFGSVARDRAHRDSDVDVGLLLSRPEYPGPADRFDAQLRLNTRLQEAVGRDVDLVILNDAPPHLARHIMTDGRQLMVTDPALDHAHRCTMLSRAADLEPFLRRTRELKLASLQ